MGTQREPFFLPLRIQSKLVKMAFIECEYHGPARSVFACPEIRELVQKRKRIPRVIRTTFVDFEEADPRYRITANSYYCYDCAVNHRLPSKDGELSSDKFREIYLDAQLAPTCFKCLGELRS